MPYFVMNQPVMLNTGDYDEALVGATYIHLLFQYSDNLELSGSTRYFHQEFSELVRDSVEVQI